MESSASDNTQANYKGKVLNKKHKFTSNKLSHEALSSLRSQQSVSYSWNSLSFMESEGSLPWSQEFKACIIISSKHLRVTLHTISYHDIMLINLHTKQSSLVFWRYLVQILAGTPGVLTEVVMVALSTSRKILG
jgi:hypothetical protein